ncbi:MAG: arsenite methyltransferase [Anaerolineales bacterium]|jgi:arsenite methyltransferase|nr:arsenite methyltransferase [Anaerolineales bacterium]
MTTKEKQENPADVRTYVRERYGKIAEDFSPNKAASCCGPAASESSCCGPETSATVISADKLYEMDISELPEDVTGLSLGCGDPVTLASLESGQTVLDLGSGGGIDCFLAAKQVGETGQVIGVDMTTSMIEKARHNKAKMGVENVEFRLGEIEHLPVADETVDVVISNCVINLSPDKPQVFREAFRVLNPGGKLSVSDIVTDGPLPKEIKRSMSAWAGCVAGALDADEYIAAIEAAGFTDIEIKPVYFDKAMIDNAVEQLDLGEVVIASTESLEKSVYSAKVTARKPG